MFEPLDRRKSEEDRDRGPFYLAGWSMQRFRAGRVESRKRERKRKRKDELSI